MKKTLTIILCIITVGALAQTTSYKITKDDPLQIRKLEIVVNPLVLDFIGPLDKHLGGDIGIATNLKINYFPIASRIGVNVNILVATGMYHKGYGKFNISGTYAIKTSTNKYKHAFVIDRKGSSNYYSTTTTTTTISIPQTRQRNIELRAGVSRNRGSFGYVPFDLTIPTPYGSYIDFKSVGVSAGIQLRNFYHQEIEIKGSTLANSDAWVLYADALIMPFNRYSVFDDEYTKEEIKDNVKDKNVLMPIGGLVGFRYSGNRYKLFGHSFGAEVGLLTPSKALLVSFNWGFTLNFK